MRRVSGRTCKYLPSLVGKSINTLAEIV
uniref:Uncharacterized protein n=1 Tax=Anguilla anguilla TaxID=7936 RepID=A0A0E9S1W1_ANGAN